MSVYTDHDPHIAVELTGEHDAYCIRVKINGETFMMHTRSAVDLNQKLSKAILDWIGSQVENYHGYALPKDGDLVSYGEVELGGAIFSGNNGEGK